MGYWKNRHSALEQDFEAFRTEAGAFRTEKTELAKISKDQRLFIQILESEALTLRATSTMLTNSCASLRTANNELAERLRKQVIRLAPVLPPTPERVLAPCTRMHLSLNDIEARAALHKDNEEQRKIITDLRRSHEITTQEVGVGRSVISDLRRDNKHLADRVRELTRQGLNGPQGLDALSLSLNEIEAKAALRKENDELRDRCVELKTILRDVQAFVEALDRK
jgi:hypothetical protein